MRKNRENRSKVRSLKIEKRHEKSLNLSGFLKKKQEKWVK